MEGLLSQVALRSQVALLSQVVLPRLHLPLECSS
jgi:hypothetical protein